MATATDDFKPFRFLDLPYEIRAKILGMLFKDGWKILHLQRVGIWRNVRYFYPKGEDNLSQQCSTNQYGTEYQGLMLANHQLHNESKAAMTSSKTGTVVYSDSVGVSTAPGQWYDQAITKVIIEYPSRPPVDQLPYLRSRFQNLLVIEFKDWSIWTTRAFENLLTKSFGLRDVLTGKYKDLRSDVGNGFAKLMDVNREMLDGVSIRATWTMDAELWDMPKKADEVEICWDDYAAYDLIEFANTVSASKASLEVVRVYEVGGEEVETERVLQELDHDAWQKAIDAQMESLRQIWNRSIALRNTGSSPEQTS